MKPGKYLHVNIIIILLLFGVPSFAAGAPAASSEISLTNVTKEVLQFNPEIASAKRAYESANARVWQAASLSDPMLEYRYDRMTADRMLSGDPMNTWSVSQDIPFPTKLYFRAKIAAKLAKMAYEAYRAKEKEITARAKTAYAELFFTYKSIEINKENESILKQISESASARYSKGLGSQADVLKAQVELATVETELIMLEEKRLTAQARLNVLLNKNPADEIGTPEPEGKIEFTKTLDECFSSAKENNPELKAYRYAIEKGKAAYDLSVNEFMPDFTVKFEQMINKGRFDSDAWAGMVGATIPLWFFEKQAFGVKEMRSELEMLKAEYDGEEKNVLFDVRDAYARFEADKKLVELYETSFLPQAEETFNAALTGYGTNKTDFITLLDSRRMLTDFKLKHYDAILGLRVALADLERAMGFGDAAPGKGTYEKK